MSTQKQASINEMILATLKTKQNKKPKYYDELVELGYPPIKTTWSCYDYWGFDTPRGELALSKDSKDKRRLFVSFLSVHNSDKNLELIDFKNLIDKVKYRDSDISPYVSISKKIRRYKKLKREISDCSRWITKKCEEREKIIKSLDSCDNSIHYYQGKIDKNLLELKEILGTIK